MFIQKLRVFNNERSGIVSMIILYFNHVYIDTVQDADLNG